jgi:uncharacterized protein (UPF0335 family)
VLNQRKVFMARKKTTEAGDNSIEAIYEENKHDIHAVFAAAREAGIDDKEVYAHIIELKKAEKE